MAIDPRQYLANGGMGPPSGAGVSPADQMMPGPAGPGGPPPGLPQTPGYGGTPEQQIVWSAFPSTDPTQIGQLLAQMQGQGAGSLPTLLQTYLQMIEQDQDKLHSLQSEVLQEIVSQLAGPGAGTEQPMGPGPGVGNPPAPY